MTNEVWQLFATDGTGDVLPSPTVEVRLESSGALASIFEDAAGATPLTNPFTGAASGFVQFYAAPERYKIVITSGANSATYRNELLGLPDLEVTTAKIAAGAVTLPKLAAEYGKVTMQQFTASGTYTKPADLRYAEVWVVGGGGGGGKNSSSPTYGGGGGGGTAYGLLEADDIASTETVTIGSGGAGATSGGGAGTAGGNSSFGALITANGGGGGGFGGGTGGGTGGTDIDRGVQGSQGGNSSSVTGGTGNGGNSLFGHGGRGDGSGALGYGGGGGGNTSGGNAGAGTDGIVIVVEHY